MAPLRVPSDQNLSSLSRWDCPAWLPRSQLRYWYVYKRGEWEMRGSGERRGKEEREAEAETRQREEENEGEGEGEEVGRTERGER